MLNFGFKAGSFSTLNCDATGTQLIDNHTFDCGVENWTSDPTYPATITDNGDGSLHVVADTAYGSLVPDFFVSDSLPDGSYDLTVDVRNITGVGKASIRDDGGTWHSQALVDGNNVFPYTGTISTINVGADNDASFVADFELIGLEVSVDLPIRFHMKVTAAAQPTHLSPTNELVYTDNGDGTWDITSVDTVGVIQSVYKDMTAIEIIQADDLVNIEEAWLDCIHLESFHTGGLTSVLLASSAWSGCDSMVSFNAEGLTSVTDISGAWKECTSLESFDSTQMVSAVSCGFAWNSCDALASFNASGLVSAENINEAWATCALLTEFDSSSMVKITTMASAWQACSGLTYFMSSDFSSVTNTYSAWAYCSSLICIDKIDTTGASTARTSMFLNCSSIVQPDVTAQADLEDTDGAAWVNANPCPDITSDIIDMDQDGNRDVIIASDGIVTVSVDVDSTNIDLDGDMIADIVLDR